jgi:hypothetical protein
MIGKGFSYLDAGSYCDLLTKRRVGASDVSFDLFAR